MFLGRLLNRWYSGPRESVVTVRTPGGSKTSELAALQRCSLQKRCVIWRLWMPERPPESHCGAFGAAISCVGYGTQHADRRSSIQLERVARSACV